MNEVTAVRCLAPRVKSPPIFPGLIPSGSPGSPAPCLSGRTGGSVWGGGWAIFDMWLSRTRAAAHPPTPELCVCSSYSNRAGISEAYLTICGGTPIFTAALFSGPSFRSIIAGVDGRWVPGFFF